MTERSKRSYRPLARDVFRCMSADGKLYFLSEYMNYYVDRLPGMVESFPMWMANKLSNELWYANQMCIKRYQYTCYYCGARLDRKNKTLDHFFPKSLGGRGKDNNLPCCKMCNSWKGSKTPHQWLGELRTMSKKKVKYGKESKNYSKVTIDHMADILEIRIKHGYSSAKTSRSCECIPEHK